MKRTKAAPLRITVFPSQRDTVDDVLRYTEISRVLAPHASRMKYLCAMTSSSRGLEGLKTIIAQAMPILHRLELNSGVSGFDAQLDISSKLPRLVALKLYNVRLPLWTSLHANLTSFIFVTTCHNVDGIASAASLLHAIKCMPLLQFLEIDQHPHATTAPGEGSNPVPGGMVQLPHLKSLLLSLAQAQLRTLLHTLTFPRLESSAIACYGRCDQQRWLADAATVDGFFTLLSNKPNLFPKMSGTTAQRTAFFHVQPRNRCDFIRYGDGLEMSLYKTIMPPDELISDWPTPKRTTPYRITLVGSHDAQAQTAFWRGAKALFSLHLFPSIRVSGLWPAPVWDGISTLPTLSTVVIDQALRKHGDDLDHFLTAAASLPPPDQNNLLDAGIPIPFASLECLWIGPWHGRTEYTPNLPNPDRLALLVDVLSKRLHLGMKDCAVAIFNPPGAFEPVSASLQQLITVASDFYLGSSNGLDNFPFEST